MRTQSRTAAPPSDTTAPSRSYIWWSMTSIVLGGYISVLNNHVINVVIPKMMSGLGTDVVTIRWVVTSYMLSNAVFIPLSSWLARVLGARQVYIYSLILFTSSAVLCGMATSVDALIFLRAIQGIGGGLIMPVTMMLMLDLYPPEKRGLGTAIWGMGASCGSLTGIPLGGILAEQVSWRAAFYANVPPGIIALIIAIVIMKPSPRERGVPFDWFGFLTLGTALVTLLIALSNGQREGWDSAPIVTLLLIFAASLVAFVLIEPRVNTPMVDLSSFRSPQYAIAFVLCLIAGGMFSGGPFILSLWLQRLYDFSVQQASMIMFPSSAFLVLFTSVAGWASDRVDHRALMVLGYLCYIIFGLIMMFADLRLTAMMVMLAYFGRGLGLGMTYSVVYSIGISAFDAVRGKQASVMLNLCIVLGGALTVSSLATIIEQRQGVRQAWLAETQQLNSVGTQRALETFPTLTPHAGGSAQAKAMLSRMINRQAQVLAFNDGFAMFVVICSVGLVLAIFFRRARPPDTL